MVVIGSRRPGVYDGSYYTPKMITPSNPDRVAAAMRTAGNWAYIRRLNGLGEGEDTKKIPEWVYWGAGGVVAGAAVYYLFLKKK